MIYHWITPVPYISLSSVHTVAVARSNSSMFNSSNCQWWIHKFIISSFKNIINSSNCQQRIQCSPRDNNSQTDQQLGHRTTGQTDQGVLRPLQVTGGVNHGRISVCAKLLATLTTSAVTTYKCERTFQFQWNEIEKMHVYARHPLAA